MTYMKTVFSEWGSSFVVGDGHEVAGVKNVADMCVRHLCLCEKRGKRERMRGNDREKKRERDCGLFQSHT